MSCHHSDGIGNPISDSIPIKPFVELFASLDSGRPQGLCASLTMKKRVDITISWILYHKDVDPEFLYAWSLPNMGWVSWILHNPSRKRNLREKKDRNTEEKREECTVCAKDMLLSLSASCFDRLDWSLAHQICKTHPGQRCWRTFHNEPGTQGSKLLLPLLGWNHFWIHPFSFLEWSFKIPGGFKENFFFQTLKFLFCIGVYITS